MDILATKVTKSNPIWNVSNPNIVQRNANKYFGKKTPVYISNNKNKKYYIYNENGKKIHFGYLPMEDYTYHRSKDRRDKYLARASKIKGDWRENKYSPNMMSMSILWD